MISIFYIFGRITSPTLIRRNVFRNHTTSPNNCPFANSDGVADNRIHTDEHIVFNVYLAYPEHATFPSRVKVVSQNLCARRYRHIVADKDFFWSHRIYQHTTIYQSPSL